MLVQKYYSVNHNIETTFKFNFLDHKPSIITLLVKFVRSSNYLYVDQFTRLCSFLESNHKKRYWDRYLTDQG